MARHGHPQAAPLLLDERPEIVELSGQELLPVIEMDGDVYRAESDEMAARVRSGSLRAA